MNKLLYLAIMALSFAACSRPYVIVQIADAQFGFTASDKCQEEGIEYDFDVKYERECLTKAVAFVNEIEPDAVVFTGDQVHHANNEQEWKAFRRVVYGIDKKIDVFHIPGNHDVQIWDSSVNIHLRDNRNVDMSTFETYYPNTTFCHEEKNLALVGMNSNLVKYDDPREGDQFAWLHKTLERNKDKVTIIFGHHPFFLKDVEEEDGYFQIRKSKRKIYFELFDKYGVDAVYTGHLHDNSEGEYLGIHSKTTTSVARQLGEGQPSVRVITISKGKVYDEIVPIL